MRLVLQALLPVSSSLFTGGFCSGGDSIRGFDASTCRLTPCRGRPSAATLLRLALGRRSGRTNLKVEKPSDLLKTPFGFSFKLASRCANLPDLFEHGAALCGVSREKFRQRLQCGCFID